MDIHSKSKRPNLNQFIQIYSLILFAALISSLRYIYQKQNKNYSPVPLELDVAQYQSLENIYHNPVQYSIYESDVVTEVHQPTNFHSTEIQSSTGISMQNDVQSSSTR